MLLYFVRHINIIQRTYSKAMHELGSIAMKHIDSKRMEKRQCDRGRNMEGGGTEESRARARGKK